MGEDKRRDGDERKGIEEEGKWRRKRKNSEDKREGERKEGKDMEKKRRRRRKGMRKIGQW